jgi:hypothetical protein
VFTENAIAVVSEFVTLCVTATAFLLLFPVFLFLLALTVTSVLYHHNSSNNNSNRNNSNNNDEAVEKNEKT